MVDTFCDRVLADDEIDGYVEGMAMDGLRAHQTTMLSAAAGGSDEYSGRCVLSTRSATSSNRTSRLSPDTSTRRWLRTA